MSGKRKFAINGTINQLDELVHKAGIRMKTQEQVPQLPAPALAMLPSVPEKLPAEHTDEEDFAEAMEGVDRLSWRHDPHPSTRPARPPTPDPEIEERRLMQQAIDEEVPITIPDHPEYIEGWVGVVGKRFIPNLRSGLYSIQGQIDLHGLNRVEAQDAVEEYIIRMSRFRSCCVKIIHGRGINSPADRTTLKESLQRLLSTRKMSKYVVAYASAPSRDGGVGAVYVLLKNSRQSAVAGRQ
jgi:DNA-nicking Smr family endonuclease